MTYGAVAAATQLDTAYLTRVNAYCSLIDTRTRRSS
jgi:hypothetical protein